MNKKQKIILVVVGIAIFCMLLYPPYHQIWSEGRVYGRGYGWIFTPIDNEATVDIGLLFTQWVAVGAIGGIAYFMCKDR